MVASNMRVNIKKAKKMAVGGKKLIMDIHLKESYIKGITRDLGDIKQMIMSTKEDFNKGFTMDMQPLFSSMGIFIKVSSKMESTKGEAYINGLMERSMMVSGTTI